MPYKDCDGVDLKDGDKVRVYIIKDPSNVGRFKDYYIVNENYPFDSVYSNEFYYIRNYFVERMQTGII